MIFTIVFIRHGCKAYKNGKHHTHNLDPPIVEDKMMPHLACARIISSILESHSKIGNSIEGNFKISGDWVMSPFVRTIQTADHLRNTKVFNPGNFKVNILLSEYLGNQSQNSRDLENFMIPTGVFLTKHEITIKPVTYPCAYDYLITENNKMFRKRVECALFDVLESALSGRCLIVVTHGYFISIAHEIIGDVISKKFNTESIPLKPSYPNELGGFSVVISVEKNNVKYAITKV